MYLFYKKFKFIKNNNYEKTYLHRSFIFFHINNMTFKTLLSTVVWGEDYLEIFLEYTLKSLCTHGNLLNKEFSKKSEYIIFTEENYFRSIRNHKNFKKLKKKLKLN